MNYSESQIDFARSRLSQHVLNVVRGITRRTGLNYEESDNAPSTYEGLRIGFNLAYHQHKPVLVSKSASYTSIYKEPYVNWAMRFWHDYLHYGHSCSFSIDGELEVAQVHCLNVGQEFGFDSIEYKLMHADTYGQLMYYEMHKEFPDDQLEFALSYISKH